MVRSDADQFRQFFLGKLFFTPSFFNQVLNVCNCVTSIQAMSEFSEEFAIHYSSNLNSINKYF